MEKLTSELETKAQILWRLFTTIVSHSVKRNQYKHGPVHYPAICMAVATVLKERNKIWLGYRHCYPSSYSNLMSKNRRNITLNTATQYIVVVLNHTGIHTFKSSFTHSKLHGDNESDPAGK